MSNRIVIGLCGAKGSGKTTFAEIVLKHYPDVKVMALANKLKDVCSDSLQIDRESFDHPNRKERMLACVTTSRGRYPLRSVKLTELTVLAVASLLDAFKIAPTDENVLPHVGKRLYTPRQVAQYVGTEILRSQDEDIHCKGLLMDAPKNSPFIVSDLRFPNEYEFFARRFGANFVPFYIFNQAAETVAGKDPHESERHLAEISGKSRVIANNDTLEHFEQLVLEAVAPFLGGPAK